MPNVDPAGHAKQLLDGVRKSFGMTPNMMKVMASSPAALGGYLNFSAALAGGVLDAKFREQIALAVAQANDSEYSLYHHAALAKSAGMSEEEIESSRRSRSEDAKRDAGLKFVLQLVVFRGKVDEKTMRRVRAAGYTDAEIIEVVANVGLEIFADYFNHVAAPEPDFPAVPTALGVW